MAPFPPEATCVLPMSAREYYAIQNQPSFRSLFASVMDLELEILDVWEKDGISCERVRNRPNYEKWVSGSHSLPPVPKIGRKFVKPDDIAFIDETEYAPKSQAKPPYNMRINSILPLLGDRVQIRRVVIITEVDEGHCRHTITGEVKVRIVGIGKLVEKYVMENTISALGLLDSVVARYKKVRESIQADQAPADLPDDLKLLLQEPYHNAHPVPSEDVSAQTGYAAPESDAEDSALSSPRRLDRSSTVFYDVEDKLWDSDMDIEKYLESSDEEIEAEEQDGSGGDKRLSPDEGEAPEISSKIGKKHNLRARMRARRHADKEHRHRRSERTREFFDNLGQSMRRRRSDAISSGQADLLSSRGEKEEVLRWNENKERWERVWESSRPAHIPHAFEKVFSPLTKAVDRMRSHRDRDVPTDSEESVTEDSCSPPKPSKSSKFFANLSINKHKVG